MKREALLVVSVVLGCGGSGKDVAVDAAATDAARDAAPDAGAATITISGVAHEWTSPTTFGPVIAGAMVCVLDAMPSHCVTTDAQGDFVLDRVPASADTGIAFSKAGYLRTAALLRTDTADETGLMVGVVTDAVLQQKLQDAGGTYPLAGTGIVEVGAFVMSGSSYSPADGVTETLTPASGTGPVYLGTDGYPDTGLSATSTEGGAMFVNVAPGTVEVALTLAGKSCVTLADGWNGSTAGTLRMPAEADTLTYKSVLCL